MKIIIVILLFVAGCVHGEPLATYLSWKKNPESTMVIHWISSKEEKSNIVGYKNIHENEWTFAVGKHIEFPDNDKYLIHIAELTQLTPDSLYQFQTGNDDNIYKFHTAPDKLEKPLQFVVGGDMYHDTSECLEETCKKAAEQNPAFALIGGDIAYCYSSAGWRTRPQRWLEFLTTWKKTMVTKDGCLIPIIPTLGNHDVHSLDKAKYFYALFAMPGPNGYNVLDFGDYMTVILLDSGHVNAVEGSQSEWLDKTLKERSLYPHKFALYHIPAWPSVRSPDSTTGVEIRKYWIPLFEKYGLNIAFENHNHAYKRTPRIYEEKVNNDAGVVYIGDGAWGVEKARAPKSPKQRWYIAKSAQERHFLLVTLDNTSRNIKAITPEGKTIDELRQ